MYFFYSWGLYLVLRRLPCGTHDTMCRGGNAMAYLVEISAMYLKPLCFRASGREEIFPPERSPLGTKCRSLWMPKQPWPRGVENAGFYRKFQQKGKTGRANVRKLKTQGEPRKMIGRVRRKAWKSLSFVGVLLRDTPPRKKTGIAAVCSYAFYLAQVMS